MFGVLGHMLAYPHYSRPIFVIGAGRSGTTALPRCSAWKPAPAAKLAQSFLPTSQAINIGLKPKHSSLPAVPSKHPASCSTRTARSHLKGWPMSPAWSGGISWKHCSGNRSHCIPMPSPAIEVCHPTPSAGTSTPRTRYLVSSAAPVSLRGFWKPILAGPWNTPGALPVGGDTNITS